MGVWVVSLQAQKCELFPSIGYHPHQKIECLCPSPDHRPYIEKKVPLISFRQILPKILLAMYFQLHNHDLWLELNPLIQNSI